ncbi:BTB/POZ protein [Rhizophagus clarus]|uniref:BTB/POZ protein n=1 Tax=Rhizophagus clarus TaxID=94130 RepID=A0A8H3LGF1_9GLOM|nr:BTB/POZ protein [Rhizophagus clarus]
MPSEYLQEVANDLEKLLENEDDFNVIIYVGENEHVKEIHAHSNILRTRSQYFRIELSKESSEKKDGNFIFRKHNISPQLFKVILRFIYCGRIDLERLQGSDILELLIAVDELGIRTLVQHIREHLIKNQSEFLKQNLFGILEAVYQNENFAELLNLSLKKICKEPEILFNSDKFISLKPPLLELVLKRDDLLLDEIAIWDNLIKWCLAQHSNIISHDPTKWNNEEITIMERTVHKFIPLIRASRDVGGYDPISWDNSDWKSTYESFIFSFTNKNDFNSAKVSYSNGDKYSVGCFIAYGPCFGGNKTDMCFHKGTWYSNTHNKNNCSYPKIDIPTVNFIADDYEVFQVVKI